MRILKSTLIVLALYSLLSAGAVSALADVIAVNWTTGVFYNVSTTNAALTLLATAGITNLAEIEPALDGTLYGFTTSSPVPTLYRFDSDTYAPTRIGQLATASSLKVA